MEVRHCQQLLAVAIPKMAGVIAQSLSGLDFVYDADDVVTHVAPVKVIALCYIWFMF